MTVVAPPPETDADERTLDELLSKVQVQPAYQRLLVAQRRWIGADAGDDVLRRSVAAWRRELRAGDLLGRIDGDAFGVALPACSAEQAHEVLVDRADPNGAADSAVDDERHDRQDRARDGQRPADVEGRQQDHRGQDAHRHRRQRQFSPGVSRSGRGGLERIFGGASVHRRAG